MSRSTSNTQFQCSWGYQGMHSRQQPSLCPPLLPETEWFLQWATFRHFLCSYEGAEGYRIHSRNPRKSGRLFLRTADGWSLIWWLSWWLSDGYPELRVQECLLSAISPPLPHCSSYSASTPPLLHLGFFIQVRWATHSGLRLLVPAGQWAARLARGYFNHISLFCDSSESRSRWCLIGRGTLVFCFCNWKVFWCIDNLFMVTIWTWERRKSLLDNISNGII